MNGKDKLKMEKDGIDVFFKVRFISQVVMFKVLKSILDSGFQLFLLKFLKNSQSTGVSLVLVVSCLHIWALTGGAFREAKDA